MNTHRELVKCVQENSFANGPKLVLVDYLEETEHEYEADLLRILMDLEESLEPICDAIEEEICWQIPEHRSGHAEQQELERIRQECRASV